MLRRAVPVVVAALLAGLGGTAAHADPPPGHSVIGDGSVVGDGDYIGSADPDADVDATAGSARSDACAPLSGPVSAADAAAALARLGGQQPVGEGDWGYVVCGQDAGAADTIARLHPAAARARAHCAAATSACVVVAVWTPRDRKNPPRQAQDPPSRLGAFDHW
ncbi:MAG TPA: hypothetical protein VLM05_01350, partial [Mycobacteriales bacterium]|nr:hypothetical protein [Mycobacteriales bacterium]